MNRLLERLVALDEQLNTKSREGYNIFREPIEQQLGDERIKEVRMSIEKKIFRRFL
jgi:hypothetical protein